MGRMGWNTVWQGIAQLWGLESRTLGSTLVQLLLRPGYLISDYIGGRRKAYFPPVKMLFILAIAYMVIDYLLPYPEANEVADNFYSIVKNWWNQNIAWGMLLTTGAAILPTWLIFRYAPRNNRHTLPEGFYIQVFMSSLLMLIAIINHLSSWASELLTPLYYFVAYKQLFGYGYWGTFWRIIVGYYVVIMIICAFIIIGLFIHNDIESTNRGLIIFSILYAAVILLLPIVHYFNKKSEKKRESQG